MPHAQLATFAMGIEETLITIAAMTHGGNSISKQLT